MNNGYVFHIMKRVNVILMELLLKEKQEFFYLLVSLTLKFFKNYLKIIRNTDELVDYTDENINNTVAFNMIFSDGNMEVTEVDQIKNLRKFFYYMWNGEKLEYSRRISYCHCINCPNNWEKSCKNIKSAGKWEISIQTTNRTKTIQLYVSNKKRKI